MGIKKVVINGTKYFVVTVSSRSRIKRKIKVSRKQSFITSMREAQIFEKEALQYCAAEVARREGSGLPWGDLLEEYELVNRGDDFRSKHILRSTIWETIGTLRRFTKPWDKKLCNEVMPGDVRKLLQEMVNQGYSRSRLKAVRSAINTVFKWGIEDGTVLNVRNSPAEGIVLGRVNDEKPPLILSLTEIQKLLDAAREMDHAWFPIWFMALHTGMRSGELYALLWNDIDFEGKMITCSKSYNGRMDIIKSTKAGYWRKIPINQELEAYLIERRAIAPKDAHVLPRINQWRRGDAARVLRGFCSGIGITSVNFHALRACFATHLLNAGVTSPIVKKICGWTDEKVMTRYIRLAGIDVRGATEGLSFVAPSRQEVKVANLTDFRMQKKYVPSRD